MGLSPIVVFGAFTLDRRTRQLLRDGAVIALSPKAYELLNVLIEARPAAVSKRELHERLWPDTFVSDVRLAGVISELRRALTEVDAEPACVRTVHRFGYAFSAVAEDREPPPGAAGGTATNWLVYNERELPLPDGEYIVGRGEEVAVRLPSATVSRRHAAIRVANAIATVEDLGSKNGTSVDGEPISAPVRLADGARIEIGGFELTYRSVTSRASTETQVKR